MKPSRYQQDFYNAVTVLPDHIVLRSTAGSGKTTSGVEACKLIPYGKRVLYAAFNKHIVTELKGKLPPTVDCHTLHSIGCRSIYNHYPQGSVAISKNKQIKRFISHLFEREKTNKERWSKTYEVDEILRKVRATMTPLGEKEIGKMCENFNLYPDDDIINATIVAGTLLYEYNRDIERHGIEVDFQDMIELPVRDPEIRVPQYDFVFLDEAQDVSKLDQLFVDRLIKKQGGRLIAIGDNRQSIYGFRGSDVRSFEHFVNRPHTLTLPLTISYRCGKKIVEHAKTVYPEIEPWEENKEGEVRKGTLDEVRNGDMVLARNVRPLVEAFFILLEQGKKCTIVGKEIEKGLLAVLKDIDNEVTSQELTLVLKRKLEGKANELKAKGFQTVLTHPKYVSLQEKAQVIEKIATKCTDVREIEQRIEAIFNDSAIAPIKLLTIHKSKGLECERVFLIERFEGKWLIPNQYAVTKDQLVQEQNLKFVAYTRAKSALIKVNL